MADEYTQQMAPNSYFDRHFDCDAIKILPGEFFVTPRDLLIVTVLGSCVSACIRDRLTGIGGMNHFMLPGNPSSAANSDSARYGVYAMEILLNHLMKLGAKKDRLEAKVFGGGNVLPGMTHSNIGGKNADFVLEFLETETIPVIGEDLGQNHPRKVYFFPNTGRVLVKRIRQMHNNTIIQREIEYISRLDKTKVEGDVELF